MRKSGYSEEESHALSFLPAELVKKRRFRYTGGYEKNARWKMETFFQIDGNILLWIQDYIRNPILNPVFEGITHLGDAGIFWIILTAVLLCFRKTRKAGVVSAAALIGSLLVNNVCLKNWVGRVRPYEVVDGLKILIAAPADPSFPSGHSGASFASAVAIFQCVPRKWGVPLLILAVLIALSRLYVGVHYPTDVLAGTVIGILLGILAKREVEAVIRYREKKRGTV